MRDLVRTLYFPPAEAEFYEGPKAVWLRDILDQLPSLQSLVTSQLSSFDHQALQAVHQKYGETSANTMVYRLRMLIAAGCRNTTGTGFNLALQHFPDLVFLDLSSSQGARNPQILQQIGSLWQLKILRLNRCGFKDEDAEYISFPKSLLSLDISDNHFTTRGITEVFRKLPQARYGPPSQSIPRYSNATMGDNLLAGSLEKYVRDKLIRTHHSTIEEGLPQTFSQLFLIGNSIDVQCITKSLNHLSLDHLDCGSLMIGQGNMRIQSGSGIIQQINPVSFTSSFGNLRSLRIHHSIITSLPFFETEVISSDQIERNLEDNAAADSLQLLTHQLIRHQRTAEGERNPARLKVSMLPNLKVLTLTDLPAKTRNQQITNSLIVFIKECADGEQLAQLEYLSQFQDQKGPPDWGLRPTLPLRLRKIVLEVSSEIDESESHASNTLRPAKNKFTKSSTEDPDSEAFMQASEGDFSFFGDDGDSGQLVREGRVEKPAFGYERAVLEARSENTKWIDVISALVAFRKESKARFDIASRRNVSDIERVISSHWIGEIKVFGARR